jgi:hypothetical protein
MPNSRLLSAEVCVSATTYVRASRTTKTNLCLSAAESSDGTRITASAACTTSSASGLGNPCEMSIANPPESQGSGRRSDLRRDGASGPHIRLIRPCSCGRAQDRSWKCLFAGILSQPFGLGPRMEQRRLMRQRNLLFAGTSRSGATGLEPATSGVTGRPGATSYDRLRPGITGYSGDFLTERTGSDRLRPASTRHSLCGRCVVGVVPSSTTGRPRQLR